MHHCFAISCGDLCSGESMNGRVVASCALLQTLSLYPIQPLQGAYTHLGGGPVG